VAIGKYCIINGILKPPSKVRIDAYSVDIQICIFVLSDKDRRLCPNRTVFFLTLINFYRDCIIEAASIGSHVKISRSSIIGRFAIIKDCCWIMEDSVLAPNTVVAPFSIMQGNPARCVGELGEGWGEVREEFCGDYYHKRFLLAM
jgi:acetyltransferase-like isoleucine patch superfamily enzyme